MNMIEHRTNLCCVLAIIMAHFMFAPFSAVADDGATKVAPITIPQVRIAPDLIPKVEESAMNGSASDAVKLADHFGDLGIVQTQIYWLEIAVENGDQVARFNLARMLARQDDALQKIRARYWYNRIIADAPAEQQALARRELEAWEVYEKKYKAHFEPSNR